MKPARVIGILFGLGMMGLAVGAYFSGEPASRTDALRKYRNCLPIVPPARLGGPPVLPHLWNTAPGPLPGLRQGSPERIQRLSLLRDAVEVIFREHGAVGATS
jgi:hypothetical protein